MGELAMSPPSIDPSTSKVVSISTQIMIGTIIVLFFVVAFCFFLHLYARCYWSNMNEDRSIVSWRRQLAHQRRRPSSVPAHRRGLDPAALRSLPVIVYNPKDFKEGLECAVCLSEVTEGEKARLLPKCNHGFHVECIDMWFKSHSTCPLCRNSVISTENQQSNDEVQDENGYDSSESDNSDDDDDNDVSNGSFDSSRTRESPVFPTNILIWGNETQVSSFGQAANAATSSSSASSSGVGRPRNHEIVIEIPNHHEFCDDCVASPPLEEAKTPAVTRLASLKRLLSFGKRVVSPSPRAASSSSCDVVQQV